MIRYIQLALVVSIFSCTSNSQEEISDWELQNSETIEHFENDNKKIQVIYSTLNTGILSFKDTSIILQRFADTLLLEEIQYNLEDGDSSKWSHKVSNYNTAGFLTEEIDSVDGSLRNHSLHFYEDSKLIRSEFLSIIPDYNDMMELVGTDTIRSVIHRYYDGNDKCVRVMALSKDELSSELTEISKYDTTMTFNEFDERGNQIQSLSKINGDTTSMTRTEYDEFGREIRIIDASLEFGATTFKYEYDERGNRTSELMISSTFAELTITEFDKRNRPVTRKTYKPKTLANNGYE